MAIAIDINIGELNFLELMSSQTVGYIINGPHIWPISYVNICVSVRPHATSISLGALKCHCRGRQWIFKRQCLASSHIDEFLEAFADLFISLKNEIRGGGK